jgi:predicted secreted Zn-dependent protease
MPLRRPSRQTQPADAPGACAPAKRWTLGALLLAVTALCAAPASAQDWKAEEREKTYAVSGANGLELYRSIGEKGPKVGVGTVIAHTTFDLKWRRDYRPQPDGSCRLASARPFLTIVYTLPKPSGKLPAPLAARWQTFIDGIRRHERVHGEHIREMVERIISTTVGVSVPDDPGCKKIRQVIQDPLAAASNEQRQRSRDFDRVEMNDGGNVHRLVLALLDGS